MYRIEIPVPQGKVVFGPRTIGDIGPDILAFKIAIGLVLPPNSERNRELLVSAQEAAYNSTFTSQIPQDNSSWFDCYEGTNIDIQRASTFDIRTKNAVTKFQIDNLIYASSSSVYGGNTKKPFSEKSLHFHPGSQVISNL